MGRSAREPAAVSACLASIACEHLTRPHPVSGWFAKAVTESGVLRLTPHDLRRTAASLAMAAGPNVKAVQKMLGHADAAITLDIYADMFDDDLKAVAVALHEARSRASVAKMWPRSGHGAMSQSVVQPVDSAHQISD
jgi:Phage integrase family